MEFDLIRHNLYHKYIKYGGVFNEHKSFYGVGEDCNNQVINRIFQDLMDLRTNNKEEYYSHLKVLLIDGYAIHEMLDPSDELEEMLEMFNSLFNFPGLNTVVNELKKGPDKTISHIIKNSPNIKTLDESLSNQSLMYSLKGFIISTITGAERQVNYNYIIEEEHYAALKKPQNVAILSKYFAQAEFQSIYYRMIKKYVIKHPAEQNELFHSMLIHLVSQAQMKSENIVKDMYGLHLYFINHFKDEISDIYFYGLARYIYSGLIDQKRNIEENSNAKKMLNMLANPETSINEIKLALMPSIDNVEKMPILFGMLEYYIRNPNILPEFMGERKSEIEEFDKRYLDLFKKPGTEFSV